MKEKTTYRAFEYDGAWGVEEIGTVVRPGYLTDYTIYDPIFSERAARRIAELLEGGIGGSDEEVGHNWEATKQVLLAEGFTDATINAPETQAA